MMCGINDAIQYIRGVCEGMPWLELVINRLEYHRNQAEGIRPKYHKGMYMKDYYTCGNCGYRLDIGFDFCPKCGYRIKWNSCRCLTGLPLADAAEKNGGNKDGRLSDDGERPGDFALPESQ